MTLAVVLLVASLSAAPPVVAPVQAEWEKTQESDFSTLDRLERLTRLFISRPYVLSPLGEGEGVDPDPRLRYDAFDCLTFVETAMALVAAPAFGDVERVLDDVRYGDVPSFVNRNHFVEAQWLPQNLRKGYLTEVTRDIGGERTRVAKKAFGPERWAARKQLASMPLSSEDIPQGVFEVPFIPLDAARTLIDDMPAGTLLFVVREDFFSQPTRITHVGLVLDTAKGKVLRHAAGKPYNRVIDEPIAQFLGRNANYKKWPVSGVALYRVDVPRRLSVSVEGTLP